MGIKFKRIEPYEFHSNTEYFIYYNFEKIGYISFFKIKRKIIIGYLSINKEYQRQHYGEQVIEALLNRNVDCIIGETLKQSRGFWKKMIKKYNGVRKNAHYMANTTSSFIIPRIKIGFDDLYGLLETAAYKLP